ncbi:MAG TPA: polysaccharide biosynthesis/export family protein, partial [Hanamia sp.]|nr:polysaccharide biosynthesis/export family protein [Hanamia sp.]
MKVIRIVLFVLFTTLFCSNQLHAQTSLFDAKDLSNVKIDDYSDNELISFYNKAIQSGISESQLFNLAAARGLPEPEIIKLKNRLELILEQSNRSQTDTSKSSQNEAIHIYDTTGKNTPLQKFRNDQTIFGSELFTSNSLVFEPNLRIPAPAGYVLGPDDELIINVYGYSEKQYDLKVNEEGDIFISNVGPINVSGLSIEQARDKIKSKLASTIYRAISTGKT